MLRSPPALPAVALAAICCAFSACGDKTTPTGVTTDASNSEVQREGTTIWDFAALAGSPDGPQGNPKVFTIVGQGAVVASVSATESNPGFQVWSKGFSVPPLSDERGLGLCGNYGTGGNCGNASPGGEDEIGDFFPDSAGNLTVVPSLLLDFTGLATGSVVDSVTLGSLQLKEGYLISSSTDGSTFTVVLSGANSSGSGAVYAFAIPAGAKYLRFAQGAGGAGNNYVVESVRVTWPKP